MSEGLLFLKPCPLSRDTPSTDWDVREHKPNGRTVGSYLSRHIHWRAVVLVLEIDRAPSPAADRGYAPTRAKAMLMLKHRWRKRGPLKPGEMQVGTPEWMKDRPEYKHVIE